MFNPSDLLLTSSDFAKIARAPEVVLTLSFGHPVRVYLGRCRSCVT
jgi:hypothetical protein